MSTQIDLVPVKPTTAIVGEPETEPTRRRSVWFRLLVNDRMAAAAAVVLGLVILTAVFGPMLVGNLATHIDLDNSNQAPFTLAHGWANVLGTDPLGRSMLARLIVACRTTLSVAIPAVVISAVVGSLIGMWAGYYRGWRETLAMRVADVIMSFPRCCWPWWCSTCSPRVPRISLRCSPSPAFRCTCAPPAPSPPNCRAGCSSTRPARSGPADGPSSSGTWCRSCCRPC